MNKQTGCTLWKTIPENFESNGHKWKMKKWFHVAGAIKLCDHGFHASGKILDAMGYVIPGWICKVQVKGESLVDGDKSVHSDMMILERTKWTKEMSVELAIYAAELVLPLYEKAYPNDKRPADAIVAAKAYLKKPSSAAGAAGAAWAAGDAARDAAWAARAAGAAAWAAGDAAWAAAWAARAAGDAARDAAWAARAAGDAARDAAWAARAAAWAAGAAAWAAGAAARAAILKKIERKIKVIMRRNA